MKNKNIIILILAIISILLINGCSEKNNFGPLGSTHRHADIKVYILGNPIDFSVSKYQMQDDLVHFENRDGDVVHTHALGVTIGHMFETLGMSIDSECLTLDTGNKYCNKGNAEFKVFIKREGTNWQQIFNSQGYIIQQYDKILVTYGTEDEEEIRKQQESVTDKAKST
ncbi:MAG: hypothetical protein IH934_03660 [Nanoarchaeota archaeon]|nr:hypothetical protein [Nanoarchaeota archaeon]